MYLAFTTITWRRCGANCARHMDRKRGRRPISHMKTGTSASVKSMIGAVSGPGRADFRDRDPAVGAARHLSVHFRAGADGHARGGAGARGDRPDGADPRPRARHAPSGVSLSAPGRDGLVRGGLDLELPHRQTVALVGERSRQGHRRAAARAAGPDRPCYGGWRRTQTGYSGSPSAGAARRRRGAGPRSATRRASTERRRATSSKTSSPLRATRRCC